MTLQLIKHKESEERRRLDENKMAAIWTNKDGGSTKVLEVLKMRDRESATQRGLGIERIDC